MVHGGPVWNHNTLRNTNLWNQSRVLSWVHWTDYEKHWSKLKPLGSLGMQTMGTHTFFSCSWGSLEFTDCKPECLLLYINLSGSANMCIMYKAGLVADRIHNCFHLVPMEKYALYTHSGILMQRDVWQVHLLTKMLSIMQLDQFHLPTKEQRVSNTINEH